MNNTKKDIKQIHHFVKNEIYVNEYCSPNIEKHLDLLKKTFIYHKSQVIDLLNDCMKQQIECGRNNKNNLIEENKRKTGHTRDTREMSQGQTEDEQKNQE